MLSRNDCDKISGFAKTFANPIRVQLLCALKSKPKNVSDLCDELESKESDISQQLRYLHEQGYISKKRTGREVFYSLKNKKVLELLQKLRDLAK